jgi:HlyD family secretion protein
LSSFQAAPGGAAASLALGVLRIMAITRWSVIASALIVATAATSAVVSLVGRGPAVAEARAEEVPRAVRPDGLASTEVKPGKLSVVVKERGTLETAQNFDVFSQVEGPITMISMIPDGERVTKGQVVCELDSAALKGALTDQLSAVLKAEAALVNARLTRELAEIASKEYVDEAYPRDSLATSSEIARARSSIKSDEGRLIRTATALERLNAVLAGQGGPKTAADIAAVLDLEDRLAAVERSLERGRSDLEISIARRDVLEKFTRAKTVKQLGIAVDKARLVERTVLGSCETEKLKEAKLSRQVAACKILAPADGFLFYAHEPNHSGERPTARIEENATIRERQKIFSIPDLDGPIRLNTKVHESIVDRISPTMKARITVDAFPDLTFAGVVEAVASRPDRPQSPNMKFKVYTTQVVFSKGSPRLRPGMTARVEIFVAELDDVLSVPVQAVFRYEDKDHVAVRTADGKVDWREVTLGTANDEIIEVKQGLKAGESVVLDPYPLLTEAQKQKMPRPSPSPKAKGVGDSNEMSPPGQPKE